MPRASRKSHANFEGRKPTKFPFFAVDKSLENQVRALTGLIWRAARAARHYLAAHGCICAMHFWFGLWSAFITLLVTIGAVGTAAVFTSLTKGTHRIDRKWNSAVVRPYGRGPQRLARCTCKTARATASLGPQQIGRSGRVVASTFDMVLIRLDLSHLWMPSMRCPGQGGQGARIRL